MAIDVTEHTNWHGSVSGFGPPTEYPQLGGATLVVSRGLRWLKDAGGEVACAKCGADSPCEGGDGCFIPGDPTTDPTDIFDIRLAANSS